MQLEIGIKTETSTINKSTVLVRVQQDYRQDGAIEVSAFFVNRTVYPDGTIVDGPLIPRQATYPSAEVMAELAAVSVDVPIAQVNAILEGYTALIWGMKAAIEQPATIPSTEISPPLI